MLPSAPSRTEGVGSQGRHPPAVEAPAVARSPLGFKQKEVKGLDLLVRAVTAKGLSFVSGKDIERVLDERYPGHEATALMVRADQTLGTTTGSHWADDIVRTTYADFLGALTGKSVYPDLRARGIGLSFDGNGTVSIPSRTVALLTARSLRKARRSASAR
jgi:hypothetical protein